MPRIPYKKTFKNLRHEGFYVHDGIRRHVGDTVMVLYKKHDCFAGFVTKAHVFNGRPCKYSVGAESQKYPANRIKPARMVLTEKAMKF
jgi:hypothetical protein